MFNGGPRHGGDPRQNKSKNFWRACLRLTVELKTLLIAVIFAVLLAVGGSYLSIIAPKWLTKITDEITEGLKPNTENAQYLMDTVTKNSMSSDGLTDLEVDGVIISTRDQRDAMQTINLNHISKDSSPEELFKAIDEMPESVQQVIRPKMNMDAIWEIAFVLLGMYVLSAVLTYAEGFLMSDASNKFAQKLRARISTKINRLPLKYFDKHQAGDILSRTTNDIDTVAQGLNQSLSTLVSETVLLIGAAIMMCLTNFTMAKVAIGASIIGFILMGIVLSTSTKYFSMRQTELGKLNSHIEEIYSGLLVVKAFNGKKQADKKFDKLNKSVYTANQKSQFLSGVMHPIMAFIGNVGYVAVCITGAILAKNGEISFGTIIAFITYVRLFTSPLSRIAQSAASLQSVAAASERVFEFLDEAEMTDEANIKRLVKKSDIHGDIKFNHVHFGYDEDKVVIKDFNAEAKAGQKIAIVGPTGAGKTTMINLLMKFYDIKDGDIVIDGISTKEMTRENIHSLFTMVLQDTWLFEGTLRENIVYNRKNVSDKKIMEICKTVGLSHFIKTLPEGLDSKISETESISAGQKQLLTIARGMVEDAPFLILDEATSNVDTRTEELVQAAMDKLMEGRTSFIIAHRLSTIRNADLILVMNEGDIIESGNHDELIAKNGFYADLYNSQFAL